MNASDQVLVQRKERIEQRLRQHGIADRTITFLPYLQFDDSEFATPYEVGARIMISTAIVYIIENPDQKEEIVGWLKQEKVWDQVGDREKEYLEGGEEDEDLINALSWQLEGALILGWAVQLVEEQPDPSENATPEKFEELFKNCVALGDSLSAFLNNLSYRDTAVIFEENIFYEITTGYFRDLHLQERENLTDINVGAAFERHKALNWLRRFSGITEWDDTDTST